MIERVATRTMIERAARQICHGGVVAFPTETVYGLGADALNGAAVERIFEIKGRPRHDPLIVHVATMGQLEVLASRVPPAARELAARFWPGPLTLVLTRAPIVPDVVTAGLSTVALRMPDHRLALALIRAADRPIAAPSANPFGMVSPVTADHVRRQLGDRVDMILDGGPCRVGIESTIIALDGESPVLLRQGGISMERIEAVLGPIELAGGSDERPRAPGRLPRHYAPQTRLALREPGQPPPPGLRVGLIALRRQPGQDDGFVEVEELSAAGDLDRAAARLYHAIRRLDQLGLDLIMAELVPETGIGRGINDRLRRAAVPAQNPPSGADP